MRSFLECWQNFQLDFIILASLDDKGKSNFHLKLTKKWRFRKFYHLESLYLKNNPIRIQKMIEKSVLL